MHTSSRFILLLVVVSVAACTTAGRRLRPPVRPVACVEPEVTLGSSTLRSYALPASTTDCDTDADCELSAISSAVDATAGKSVSTDLHVDLSSIYQSMAEFPEDEEYVTFSLEEFRIFYPQEAAAWEAWFRCHPGEEFTMEKFETDYPHAADTLSDWFAEEDDFWDAYGEELAVLGLSQDDIEATDEEGSVDGWIVGYAKEADDCILTEPTNFTPSLDDIHRIEKIGVPGAGGRSDGRTVFYVNGIRTESEAHCQTLRTIAQFSGATVVGIDASIGVYNETESSVKDILQTGMDKLAVGFRRLLAKVGIRDLKAIHNNPAATMVANIIETKIRSGEQVEIFAHSQGGAVTSLALHRLAAKLDKANESDLLKRVTIVTFGSAASRWPDGPTYEHYIHVRDATPRFLGLGVSSAEDTARAGKSGTVIRFHGEPDAASFDAGPGQSYGLGTVAGTKYHNIDTVYLKMYAQEHQK